MPDTCAPSALTATSAVGAGATSEPKYWLQTGSVFQASCTLGALLKVRP